MVTTRREEASWVALSSSAARLKPGATRNYYSWSEARYAAYVRRSKSPSKPDFAYSPFSSHSLVEPYESPLRQQNRFADSWRARKSSGALRGTRRHRTARPQSGSQVGPRSDTVALFQSGPSLGGVPGDGAGAT